MNLGRSAIVGRSENMGNVNVPLTLENTVIKASHRDKIFRCSY